MTLSQEMFTTFQEGQSTSKIKRLEKINEKKEIIKALNRETAIMLFQAADIEFTPAHFLKENEYEQMTKKQQKLYIEQG